MHELASFVADPTQSCSLTKRSSVLTIDAFGGSCYAFRVARKLRIQYMYPGAIYHVMSRGDSESGTPASAGNDDELEMDCTAVADGQLDLRVEPAEPETANARGSEELAPVSIVRHLLDHHPHPHQYGNGLLAFTFNRLDVAGKHEQRLDRQLE
jgi:hypothetical protein